MTYEEWLPYWPTSTDEPFSSHINNTPKVVASTTLDKVEWGQWEQISLIKGNLAEEIAELKQRPGVSNYQRHAGPVSQWAEMFPWRAK